MKLFNDFFSSSASIALFLKLSLFQPQLKFYLFFCLIAVCSFIVKIITMLKIIFLFLLSLFSVTVFAQNKSNEKEKAHVLALLDKQSEAWNKGKLDKFMETYWKSEKLVFVGSQGPTYGWQATYNRYKKSYPDKAAMGHLTFKILDINKIDKKTFFIVGRFELTREMGNSAGHFTLVIQKIDGQWVIVSDHSSGEKKKVNPS